MNTPKPRSKEELDALRPKIEDKKYAAALEHVLGGGAITVQAIQATCKLSYNGAVQLLERMELSGVITKRDAFGKRQVAP